MGVYAGVVNPGSGGSGGSLPPAGALGNTLRSNGSAWTSHADPVPVFYAEDYGAVFDFVFPTGTDNTVAINAALTAAATYSMSNITGAIVQLPAGAGMITDTLLVTRGVWLKGAGRGTTLLYGTGWGANPDPLIKLDSNCRAAQVSDLTTDCNSGMSTSHHIQLDAPSAAYLSSGGNPTEISRVFLYQSQGDGLNAAGLEARFTDVYSGRSVGNGFNVMGSDCMYDLCTADTNGFAGFAVNSPNHKFGVCKAFGNTNDGFSVGGQRNMFSSCEAQDNGGFGMDLYGGANVASACLADTNGRNGGTQYGFALNADSSCAACHAINRSGSWQTYSYFGQVANGTYPPNIHGTSELPGTGHVAPNTVANISINNLLGSQTIAYGATIAPDIYQGGTVFVGTLTGAITINAPVQAIQGNATGPLTPFKGMRIRYVLTQDATGGRVVTWNAAYKPIVAIPTTASSITTIEYVYDGTSWQEASRSGGISALPTGAIVGTTDTQTLTNKRITKRVVAVTQAATPAINSDNMDVASITGLAQAVTSMTTSLTGTPQPGDSLIVEFTDNGTARAITWGASFVATTIALPTSTVISTLLQVGFRRDAGNTVWRCVAVA